MEHEITTPGPLLLPNGDLAQVGWARQALLDTNLEQAAFYPRWKRPLQALRVKRWDYYALFTPQRFFSATIADLGYAANVFVYTLDWRTNRLHEEGLILPAWTVRLPRNSDAGETVFEGRQARLRFSVANGARRSGAARRVSVDWPSFDGGKGIQATLALECPPGQESLAIVIPIAGKRFYYNRKINCLPAEGLIHYGDVREAVDPRTSLASLDWGRGVWEYRSYWNWASASGFLADGRRVGLNLGRGFGDTTRASENALVLEGKIHKLGEVAFDYPGAIEPDGYAKPWRFYDPSPRRIDLTFTPFKERTATSNLLLIFSEVHQMFGRYSGCVTADDGEVIQIDGLVGFAEEHKARW